MIESIDSQRLMDAVEKQAAKVGVVQDILLEVNIGQEESKGGAKREEILTLARHAAQCPHLQPAGAHVHPPRHRHRGRKSGVFPRNLSAFC